MGLADFQGAKGLIERELGHYQNYEISQLRKNGWVIIFKEGSNIVWGVVSIVFGDKIFSFVSECRTVKRISRRSMIDPKVFLKF